MPACKSTASHLQDYLKLKLYFRGMDTKDCNSVRNAWIKSKIYIPLQKDMSPSFEKVTFAQSSIPEYGCFKYPCLIISFWFCISSLILSIGAAAVLDMVAAIPEIKNVSWKLRISDFCLVFSKLEVLWTYFMSKVFIFVSILTQREV